MHVKPSLASTTYGAAPLGDSISRSTTVTRMSATRMMASPHSTGALHVGTQWRPCAGPGPGHHCAVAVKGCATPGARQTYQGNWPKKKNLLKSTHQIPLCCGRRRKSARIQGTRRPQRKRLLSTCGCIGQRLVSRLHRRRRHAVERSVAHLCWSEANVGPEAVYRIDGLPIVIGHHWLSL